MDLKDLFDGETLTEEFQDKATIIFESFVNEKVEVIKESLEKEYQTKLTESVEQHKEDLAKTVDTHLNTVVLEWAEEHAQQLDSTLKVQIAEDFVTGLRDLYGKYGIQVSENGQELLDRANAEKAAVEQELASQRALVAESNKYIIDLHKADVIEYLTESVTLDTKLDRIKKLANAVPFKSTEDFARKVVYIVETINKEKLTEIQKELSLDHFTVESDGFKLAKTEKEVKISESLPEEVKEALEKEKEKSDKEDDGDKDKDDKGDKDDKDKKVEDEKKEDKSKVDESYDPFMAELIAVGKSSKKNK